MQLQDMLSRFSWYHRIKDDIVTEFIVHSRIRGSSRVDSGSTTLASNYLRLTRLVRGVPRALSCRLEFMDVTHRVVEAIVNCSWSSVVKRRMNIRNRSYKKPC